MAQVSGSQEGVPQRSQTPELSEEEEAQVIDKAMIAVELAQLGILQIEFMLAGCLSPPDAFTLESWHRWAQEYLDHNDFDKALYYAEKITKFLEERQRLCEELERKRRRYRRNSSRRSARH